MKGAAVNRMPYIGAGGWLGVVRKESANTELAFQFLTDLRIRRRRRRGHDLGQMGSWTVPFDAC